MPDFVIKSGREFEVISLARRRALEDLRDRLNAHGMPARLEITEYRPRRYGIGPPELVAITIGGIIGKRLLDRLADDLYDMVKVWATSLFTRSGPDARPQEYTILGPDGKVLRKGRTDKSSDRDLKTDQDDRGR